jgi:hypothetical protein
MYLTPGHPGREQGNHPEYDTHYKDDYVEILDRYVQQIHCFHGQASSGV